MIQSREMSADDEEQRPEVQRSAFKYPLHRIPDLGRFPFKVLSLYGRVEGELSKSPYEDEPHRLYQLNDLLGHSSFDRLGSHRYTSGIDP